MANAAVRSASDEYVIGWVGDALAPKLMQQAEGVIARLVDSVEGAQTEVAAEWTRGQAALLEDVREGSKRHHVQMTIALAYCDPLWMPSLYYDQSKSVLRHADL